MHRHESQITPGKLLDESLSKMFSQFAKVQSEMNELADVLRDIMRQLGRLHFIEETLSQLMQGVDAMHKQTETLEHMSRTQETLSENFVKRNLVEPLARDVFQLEDTLTTFLRTREHGQPNNTVLEHLSEQLVDMLERRGVTKMKCGIGDRFNAQLMTPKGQRETADENADKKVCKVLKDGYVYNGKVLRHQEVIVFRYTPVRGLAVYRED